MVFGKMHREPGAAAFTQNLNADRGHPGPDKAHSNMAQHGLDLVEWRFSSGKDSILKEYTSSCNHQNEIKRFEIRG